MSLRRSLILAALIWLLAAPASAAITVFGSATNPADDSGATANPGSITPPGSMVTGHFVLLIVSENETGGSGQATFAVTTTGGQTWTELAESNRGSGEINLVVYWCIFDGTWDEDPAVTATPTGSTDSLQLVMHVFAGVDTSTPFDVVEVASTFAAPADPFDVTITEITTLTNGAAVVAIWASSDNNTWAVQTGSWANIGGAQYRNNPAGAGDNSISTAYRIFATAGASGDVVNSQETLGGDQGITRIMALKPAAAAATSRRGTLLGVGP